MRHTKFFKDILKNLPKGLGMPGNILPMTGVFLSAGVKCTAPSSLPQVPPFSEVISGKFGGGNPLVIILCVSLQFFLARCHYKHILVKEIRKQRTLFYQAQQVRHLPLSLMTWIWPSRTYMVEGEIQLPQVAFWPPHVHHAHSQQN